MSILSKIFGNKKTAKKAAKPAVWKAPKAKAVKPVAKVAKPAAKASKPAAKAVAKKSKKA